MASVKTAISLDESLWERTQNLAREMQVSRSRLIALALEDFIRRRENQELLEQINAAYEAEPPDEEEIQFLEQMRRYTAKILDPW